MLEPFLEELVKNDTMKMNPLIANGFVHHEMAYALEKVDQIFRSAFDSLNSNIVYMGYQRCTPIDEYHFKLKRNANGSKARYELARSDLFLVKFFFDIDGKTTRPHFIYIPFCDEAGRIHLRGTAHTISPVLEDPGLSVTRDGCFFKVTCDRVVVRRVSHTVVRETIGITGRYIRSPRHLNIPCAKMYRAKQNKSNNSKSAPGTTLPHYLFARYGVTETFRRFANVSVVCGDEHTITHKTHPDSEWIRFYSSREPHPNNKRPSKLWRPSNAAIAVKIPESNTLIDVLVGGFFYVADCYPEEFDCQYVDDIEHWRLMMGKMVFNKQVKNIQMSEYLRPHFLSLDSYLDSVAKQGFEEEGICVGDIYELFVYVITSLDGLINTVNLASMHDKRLAVLPYVLSPIIYGIFYTKFNLMQMCNKWGVDKNTGETKMTFTENELFDALNFNLKPEVIYGIKDVSHGEISSMATPGDSKIFKVNNKVVLQSNANRTTGRESESPMTDESKSLDVTIATTSSYLHMTHTDPSARSTLNLHNAIVKNKFVTPEHHKAIFDETQNIITRRNI